MKKSNFIYGFAFALITVSAHANMGGSVPPPPPRPPVAVAPTPAPAPVAPAPVAPAPVVVAPPAPAPTPAPVVVASAPGLVQTTPGQTGYPAGVPIEPNSGKPYKVALLNYRTALRVIDFNTVYASPTTGLAIAFIDLGQVDVTYSGAKLTSGGIGYLWKFSSNLKDLSADNFAVGCGAYQGASGDFSFTDLFSKNRATGTFGAKGLRVVLPDVENSSGIKSIVADSCPPNPVPTPFVTGGSLMQLWALFDPNAPQLDKSSYQGIYVSGATLQHVLTVNNPLNGRVR